jgi:hypothetical protein
MLFERSGVLSGKGEQASSFTVVSLEVAKSGKGLLVLTASGSAWKYVYECTREKLGQEEKNANNTHNRVVIDTRHGSVLYRICGANRINLLD